MNLAFIGGSMGWVVGEKISLLLEHCVEARLPVVMFCASGGARMQESLVALMQMPKTCAAVGKVNQAHLPYICVLTDPTYGGVTASFAFLGDVILAEKGAAMGFAGPRVIEITKLKIGAEVQTAEFQYAHGMIDLLISREQIRDTLADLLDWMGPN
jgi:acetyl-CoA carboxylase carboxyl transferase subunit beta